MITDVLDVAATLVYGVSMVAKEEAGEMLVGDVRRTAFAAVHPEQAVFTVQTVEGKKFRVTVTEDTT